MKNKENNEIEILDFDEIDFNEIEDYQDETPINKTKIIKELSDEIRAFRQKNKEFQATNDHDTYIVLTFSTKEDKQLFKDNTGINEHTFVDGYEFARSIKIEPCKPKFKLAKPLNSKMPKR